MKKITENTEVKMELNNNDKVRIREGVSEYCNTMTYKGSSNVKKSLKEIDVYKYEDKRYIANDIKTVLNGSESEALEVEIIVTEDRINLVVEGNSNYTLKVTKKGLKIKVGEALKQTINA